MSEQHIIKEIADILKLDDEQFERFMPDFLVWRDLCRNLQAMGAEAQHMLWIDDGKQGQIHHVVVQEEETGHTLTIKGSAWQEPKEQQ